MVCQAASAAGVTLTTAAQHGTGTGRDSRNRTPAESRESRAIQHGEGCKGTAPSAYPKTGPLNHSQRCPHCRQHPATMAMITPAPSNATAAVILPRLIWALAAEYGTDFAVSDFIARSRCSQCGARHPKVTIKISPN